MVTVPLGLLLLSGFPGWLLLNLGNLISLGIVLKVVYMLFAIVKRTSVLWLLSYFHFTPQ